MTASMKTETISTYQNYRPHSKAHRGVQGGTCLLVCDSTVYIAEKL